MTLTSNIPTTTQAVDHSAGKPFLVEDHSTGNHSIGDRVRALDHAVAGALQPFTLPALRVLLGLLFVWFGGLKIVGRSPVADLVAQTLPFADRHLVLLVLGTAEVLLGILLISGMLVRLALPALTMHLAGTFATFVAAPALMFSEGNPLLLTANGEFVAKNLVLIAATLALISHPGRRNKSRRTTHTPLPANAG